MAPMVPLPSGRASSHWRAGCRYQRRVSLSGSTVYPLLKRCLQDFGRWSTEERTDLVVARTKGWASEHYSGTRRAAALYVTVAATATIERCEKGVTGPVMSTVAC